MRPHDCILKEFPDKDSGIKEMNSESVETKAGRVFRKYYQIGKSCTKKELRREDETPTRVLEFSSGYVQHSQHSLVRKLP